MNNDDEKQPFGSVLEDLFTKEPVPIYLLYRLSDMSEDDHALLRDEMAKLEASRRRIILRHMADISEANFEVDFVPVFRESFHDEDATVRAAALDGVWDAIDASLIAPIIEMLKNDEDDLVRAAAAAALAHFVLLAEWNQLPRRHAEPIVQALLAEYDKPEVALSVRRASLEALGAAGHERVPHLIREAYESNDPGLQLSAVYAMGLSADKQWLSIVLAEIENPDATMRAEAATAAGSLGSSDALDPLESLLGDEDYEVRLAAVTAVGRIGGEAARELLVEVMEDEESEDLWEAAEEALDEIALFSGELNLIDLFEDDDDEFDARLN